jgi:hypothetical protein
LFQNDICMLSLQLDPLMHLHVESIHHHIQLMQSVKKYLVFHLQNYGKI